MHTNEYYSEIRGRVVEALRKAGFRVPTSFAEVGDWPLGTQYLLVARDQHQIIITYTRTEGGVEQPLIIPQRLVTLVAPYGAATLDATRSRLTVMLPPPGNRPG